MLAVEGLMTSHLGVLLPNQSHRFIIHWKACVPGKDCYERALECLDSPLCLISTVGVRWYQL